MFKCSTLSQYFQVKPAFFSRLFHVLPAEARLSAQNLSFCGENRREGQAPPLRDSRENILQRGTGGPVSRPYGAISVMRDMAAAAAMEPILFRCDL